jgi:hypothetical protein
VKVGDLVRIPKVLGDECPNVGVLVERIKANSGNIYWRVWVGGYGQIYPFQGHQLELLNATR